MRIKRERLADKRAANYGNLELDQAPSVFSALAARRSREGARNCRMHRHVIWWFADHADAKMGG
jgi:hypothetical protein